MKVDTDKAVNAPWIKLYVLQDIPFHMTVDTSNDAHLFHYPNGSQRAPSNSEIMQFFTMVELEEAKKQRKEKIEKIEKIENKLELLENKLYTLI